MMATLKRIKDVSLTVVTEAVSSEGRAYLVEACQCPHPYIGSSCEVHILDFNFWTVDLYACYNVKSKMWAFLESLFFKEIIYRLTNEDINERQFEIIFVYHSPQTAMSTRLLHEADPQHQVWSVYSVHVSYWRLWSSLWTLQSLCVCIFILSFHTSFNCFHTY